MGGRADACRRGGALGTPAALAQEGSGSVALALADQLGTPLPGALCHGACCPLTLPPPPPCPGGCTGIWSPGSLSGNVRLGVGGFARDHRGAAGALGPLEALRDQARPHGFTAPLGLWSKSEGALGLRRLREAYWCHRVTGPLAVRHTGVVMRGTGGRGLPGGGWEGLCWGRAGVVMGWGHRGTQ